ncbi:MAG: two-component system, cell cycle response regulator, partial [Gaiellaceae bacterium]|nr:two-component system, cell cycle response regulator [Gaiellaceae bacterium]
VIGRSLRGTDIPVREQLFDFAVILPETPRQEARIVAERIRLAVCERRLEFGPGDVVDPTVSIGVAAFPQDATTNELMMRALHRALQAAVAAHGNRTMLFSVPTESPAGWGLTREQLAP